jgi:hypothetical protein
MIDIGSTGDRRKLEALLVTHHRLDVIIQLLTTSHEYLGELSDRLLSGQVTIDTTAEITRAATLELLDPTHQLKLDSRSPEDGSLYMTRMLKITYVVSTIDRSEAYYVPIFTGPISNVTRSGPIVSVDCLGKESLAMAAIFNGRTYKKGRKRVEILRSVLVDSGEAAGKISIPDHLTSVIKSNMSANRKFTFWKLSKKLAGSLNMQLFYDGRGVARLRKVPGKSCFTFAPKGALLSLPNVGYNSDDLYNAVEVIGGKPKKAKNKIHYKMAAPKKHPLSPQSLGRNGKPRYLPLLIEDDSIKSAKAARAIARKQLKMSLNQSLDVTFDSLPIAHLEELDLCRFTTEETAGSFRLSKMTIPLVASGSSSVGYLRRVTPRRLGKPRRRNLRGNR